MALPLDAQRARPLAAEQAYALPAETVSELVRRLLQERPPPGVDRFACYRIADSSRYSDLARTVECSVFLEFFGNAPEVMSDAYGAYEQSSLFLFVVDRETLQPAGALRIITPSEQGLKTLNDIALEPLKLSTAAVLEHHGIASLEHCWDVGTLAVLKPYRGKASNHGISTMLYGMLYAALADYHIPHFVTILDKHAHRQLVVTFGFPFTSICGSAPFSYLGSESSHAVHIYLPSVAPTADAYLASLDDTTRALLRPFLARVVYGEGVPPVTEVR